MQVRKKVTNPLTFPHFSLPLYENYYSVKFYEKCPEDNCSFLNQFYYASFHGHFPNRECHAVICSSALNIIQIHGCKCNWDPAAGLVKSR